MIILVPFYGDRERFRPLLDKWIACYKSSGCRVPWFALSDQPETADLPCCRVSIEQFRDVIRPLQPFDVKGALVCAAALQLQEPLLVLDADAFLLADPMPLLASFADVPVAMAIDHGALVHFRTANLDWPFDDVRKTCAGVLWLGRGQRARVVAQYRKAFRELQTLEYPWTPPLKHLLEQYSWSVVQHRLCRSRRLPASLNWSVRILGAAPNVVVDHDYGHGKWAGRPVPANS